ncbi:MAG: hypothetical protein CFE24_13825, partial [Flavobacterium sp. BFFFF2]
MNSKFTLFLFSALLFISPKIFGQITAITPVRTDVSGFISWTDTSVGGTTYLQLLSATSKTIAPTMDFVAYVSPTLDFKLRTFGGTSGSSNVVTVSISTNNGSTYTSIGTRTASSSTLTAVTQFDLSAYLSSQIRIKFESLGATGTAGIGIDDINISGVPGCNAPLTQATFGNSIPAATSLTQVITAGSGAGRLVLFNSTNSFTDPNNGTAYTANTVYSGSGQQVVFAGTAGTSVAVTNLTSTTTYYFAIYEYNCSGSTIIYNKIENTTSGTTTMAGCVNGSMYPSTNYIPLNNGTSETITTSAFAGEYSVIEIPSTDNVYRFSSSASADFITITNSTGGTIYASGVTPLTWTSTVAANIRYYIHLNAACGTSNVARTRYIQTVSTACGSPSSPVASNLSSNSASVSWTAPATAPSSGYEVYYATATTAPTNATAGFATTSNFYFIDNLTNNTTYYFWVRSKCGTAKSPWIAGGNFKTLTTLACNSATYGLYPTTTFTPTYTGVEEQIASDCRTSQYSNINILANKQYVFKSTYLTDFITITNEAGTVVYASGQTPLTWESGTNSGVARYYFHSNSNCTSGAVLRAKSITSTTVIPCGAPTGLTAAHITSNSAYVQVTAPSSPTLTVSQYYAYISTTNSAPISTTQPTAISSTTSMFLSGLQANTTYYYWVSSSCTSSSSIWVAGGTFVTNAAISQSCNGATYGLNPTTLFTPAGTGSLELITNASAASQFSYIAISADKTYTFQSDTGTDYITITNEAGTTVITKGSSPLTWNSGTTAGTFRYYFHSQVACGSSTSARSKYVKYVPNCVAPSNFGISNIASQTVRVAWTATASAYQCLFTTSNTPPLDTVGTTDNYTTTNFFDASGLTPSTTYYSWVRAVCGFANSSWVSAGSFTTTAGGCTIGTLFPTTTFTPAFTGVAETITTQTYAGEYSNVTIQAGKNYMFSSNVSTDYVTITNSTGSTVYAFGTTPLMWSSGTNTGTIRFYIHTNVMCGTQNTNRTRYLIATTPCLTAAPTVSAQSFCAGATVANLVATGTNIKWYNVPFAGTALASTTALTTGIYYVTQTVGCESSRLDVSITVNPIMTPTFTPVADICAGASIAALPPTSNNGVTGTWSPAINNTATTTYTFTPSQGSCAPTTTLTITVNATSVPTGLSTQVYAGTTNTLANLTVGGTNISWYNASTGGTLLPSSTALVDGTTYFASQTISNCDSPSRLAVTVRAISSATQSICTNATVSNLVSTPSAGTTANWFATSSGGFPLSNNTSLSNGTYYVEQLTSNFAITSTIGSGIYTPTSVAILPDGRILVSDNYGLTRMDADGSNMVSFSSLSSLGAIALQADGKILVVDGVNAKLRRFNADGTGMVSVSGVSYPSGVAVQADGTILVAENYSTAIKKMNADGTGIVSLGSGFNSPSGLAVQADGKILIADSGSNSIKRMNADGTGIVTVANGFIYPRGIAFQPDGKILVADTGNNAVKRMNADGSGIEILGSGFRSPSGVAVQLDGSIIVADQMNDAVKKIGPGIASNRVAVSVVVDAPLPTASAQSLCTGATVANLVATGSNLKWYANSTAGAALTSNGSLTTGTYYVSQTLGTCESNRTAVSVTINTASIPTFTQVAPICISGSLAALPTTSNNGYTGTWAPALNNTTTTVYTFTPNAGQCASTAPMTITVNAAETPTFTQVSPICLGAGLSALPTTSNNGFTGTWSPVVNNLQTTTYTFAPAAGLCANTATMTITVNPKSTPTFTQIAPINSGSNLNALPTISNNGITGTWSPALNNTASTTYTFTPTAGVCAYNSLYNIVVNSVAPNISYVGGNQAFTVGSAISPLTPSNSGGSVPNAIYQNVTTIAGTAGSAAATDGIGTAARFNWPNGLALDTSGNLFVADRDNNTIRKITPAGAVSTFAGSGTSGATDGTGTSASFNSPNSVSVDGSGHVYVADYFNNKIRKITPEAAVTTFVDTAAGLNRPAGVVVDASGNIYITDSNNYKIKKVTAAGIISTLAGSGAFTSTNGTGVSATFKTPFGIAVDSTSNVYVAERDGNKIRKITVAGVVTTVAGSGTAGTVEGAGATASFSDPMGVATDVWGNLYVGDRANNKIRKITAAGVVSTLAGGTTGSTDGIGTNARFSGPVGLAVDVMGNVYVSEIYNNIIRKISQQGYTVTPSLPAGLSLDGTGAITGTPTTSSPLTTYTITAYNTGGRSSTNISFAVCATKTTPTFTQVASIVTGGSLSALPTTSNNGIAGTWSPAINNTSTTTYTFTPTAGLCATTTTMTIYVGSLPIISYPTNSQTYYVGTAITAISPNNTGGAVPAIVFGQTSTLAGSGSDGAANGTAATASFSRPTGVALDAAGNTYVADQYNHKIRKITPAGVVSTFAGSGTVGSADGTGTAASFNLPFGLTVDAAGNVYVADSGNNKIRKITPAGVVSTFAGSGAQGAADGSATAASFYFPTGVKLDSSGNLFVADFSNHKIRKISPTGTTSTFAGSGSTGSADGTGTAASFYDPVGIDMDAAGNLYIADKSNQKIRKITSAGVVSTFAGSGVIGAADGARNVASFKYPQGVAIDRLGQIYVADGSNNLIRKISTSGVVSTLAGSGIDGSDNMAGTSSRFSLPISLTVDSDLNIYVADYFNNKIRKIAQPNGGYSISPALPSGLNFNSTTGEISGTPYSASTSRNYTITGYNEIGSGSTTISITTIPNILLTGAGVGGWVEAGMVALSSTDGISFTKSRVEILGSGGASSEVKFTEGTWASALGNSSSVAGSGFPTGTASVSGSNIAATPGFWDVSYNYQTKAYSFTASSSPNPVINLSGTAVGSTAVTLSTTDGINYSKESVTFTSGTASFMLNGTSNQWSSAAFPQGTGTLSGTLISIPAGTYNVSYNHTTKAYVFQPTVVSLMGDFNSWATDVDMFTTDNVTFTLTNQVFTATTLIKFRDNHSWNYGFGSSAPYTGGTATLGGGNISVPAGNYSITFNRSTLVYSIIATPTPPTTSSQTFCADATVANLSASGTNLKWYASATGGSVLTSNAVLTTGTYYVSQTVNGVESTRTAASVTITARTTPTFTQVSAICAGATLSALPTTSTNAITGVWSPAVNNTSTTTYTFTPTAGLCATTATMTITVNPNVTPSFTQVAPICAGASLSALPTTSNNSLTGTWSPALDNAATTTYTFTPTAGLCATTATMTITVNPNVTPTFTQVSAICSGATLSALPTTSNNSLTGTWSPSVNNTQTTTYTFTPTAGLCATTATMTITVNPNITPTFTQVTPICAGATLASLPTTSNNSLTGTWSPALDNAATTTYTFTPTAGLCATTATMTITVNPNVTPTFTQVTPICSGASLSALPTTSNNSLTGTWSPALNNTATTTYTFTPTAGLCATQTTMTITVNPNVTPSFTQVSAICAGASLSAIPTTSNNSLTGTWSPALDNTATTTYTFTPTVGLCATTATMTITV